MKAIILNETPEGNILVMTEVAKPTIRTEEVLIKVKAISINPVDLKTRAGNGVTDGEMKGPIILGWDVSGIVVESRSDKFEVGDEVFGMVNFPGQGNGYAEFVAAPADHLAHKPSNISHEDAVASTLAALTAWQAMFRHATIKPGDRVLIHAAAGGVGHFAVQIAKYFGAHVIGTSSNSKADFLRSLGVDEQIDYTAGPFEEAVSDIDFVLDTLSGDYIPRSIAVLKKGGTIISIVKGMNETVSRQAAASGAKGLDILVESNGDDMKSIADLLEKGILKPHVSHVFDFQQMEDAHAQLETGRTIGKVVVTINQD
jgi:NADPH:quinone reductase-like Zn-dependent oxidoreductase